VGGERAPPCDVEVPGQPGDTAQHLQRIDIEVGPLVPPRGDEVVYLVAFLARELPHRHSLSLDVKMLDLISVPRYQDSSCQ
jgi:hypothetical protein